LLTVEESGIRLALDQNFPRPILERVGESLAGVVLVPLLQIDRSLADMPDRRLLLALDQLGWAGLVTNNHKMMQNPLEIAALLRTRLSLFVIEGLGHDPIRATGAVLLDLPGAVRKFVPDQPQVFWSRPRNPHPRRPWDIFSVAAERAHRDPPDLYQELHVEDDELAEALPKRES
jgi:hypothetical protein